MPGAPHTEGLKAASDKTRQVVTLSTGVVAITVTFFDEIGAGAEDLQRIVPWTLIAGWAGFGVAILLGLWTLGAITGTLNLIDRRANGQTLTPRESRVADALAMGANIRVPALLMDLTFVVAMGFTIAAGADLLNRPRPGDPAEGGEAGDRSGWFEGWF